MDAPESTPPAASQAIDEDISFLLARASGVSTAAGNRALAALGLKVRAYAVLAMTVDGRPSQRELARHLRLDPSQVVALVDDLERRGLVVRGQDPSDRRTNTVEATDDGLALFAQAAAVLDAADDGVHSVLDSSERDLLRSLLRKVAFADISRGG